jgi:hypothetical protein
VANPKHIDPNQAQLRELGFDPAAPTADRLAKLRELRGKSAAIDLAVARALGEINDPGAAELLVELEAEATGAMRLEIRRAIYKLRQHDIEVREPEIDRKSSPPTPSEAGLTGYMSPIDAEGAQIVWLVKARSQGGIIRLWGLISETEGLAGVQNHSISRRELKTQHDELEKQAGVKLIEIDPHLADFILCDAYRRTPEGERGKVGTFYALRSEITGAPTPTELLHPIYSQLAKESAEEPSVDLLKEPELQEFRIPPDQLKPYLEEVNRAQETVLVVSRSSQEERIMSAVEKAIVEILSGDRAMRLRRRLEDTALYMLKTGRRQQAGWAAAAAARIRDGADLKTIPLFRTLVQTQLGAMLAQETERKQAEPRLIMTPAEALRNQQEQQARLRGPRR